MDRMTHDDPSGSGVLHRAGCALLYRMLPAKKPAESEAKQPQAPSAAKASPAKPFQDDPAAHALYNQMIETLRKADSLSFVCRNEVRGKNEAPYVKTYHAWLKKPNYFRVEGSHKEGKRGRRRGSRRRRPKPLDLLAQGPPAILRRGWTHSRRRPSTRKRG